jgi:hypothetical protein
MRTLLAALMVVAAVICIGAFLFVALWCVVEARHEERMRRLNAEWDVSFPRSEVCAMEDAE